MSEILLQTKLYIPPTRSNIVPRTRLLNKLNAGLHGKLTLASAPAGFGKTTLITDERDATKVLQPHGKFLTVIGPVQHSDDHQLSWRETIGMFAYIFGRMLFGRFRGPHHIFSEKYPRLVLDEALALIAEHDMQLAIAETVPLELAAMKSALVQVASHHTQGRIFVSV